MALKIKLIKSFSGCSDTMIKRLGMMSAPSLANPGG